MGFPFPDDRIAMGRLDWCRAGGAEDADGLSCVLRARMCAAHIQASQNAAWAASANPVFSELLSAASVESWTPCPEAQVSGVCGMLLTDRYGPPLWEAFGHDREKRYYERILAGSAPEPVHTGPAALPACVYPRDA
jgi:hypothetical protein